MSAPHPIIDLGGSVITEPGFYRLPIERHHAQPCVGVSVTSGILRTMELQTPADVWAFHALNPDRWPRPETDALRMGRAMAAYVEGGMEIVARHFRVLPADAPRRPTAAQLAAYEAGRASDTAKESIHFWREMESDPRALVTAKEMALIADMGRVLAADPAAAAVMGGLPEITMAWKDEETGLWCLARPDTVAFDGTVGDYKKVSSAGRPFSLSLIDGRITAHGYDMQLAFAAEGYEALTGHWPTQAAIVAQSDAPPHHVVIREITEEDLRLGQFRNRRALRRFAECLRLGHWPGPGEVIGAYQRPDWQRQWLLEEQQRETAE